MPRQVYVAAFVLAVAAAAAGGYAVGSRQAGGDVAAVTPTAAESPEPAAAPAEPVSLPGSGPRFEGTGNSALAPVFLESGGTLRWRNSGEIFIVAVLSTTNPDADVGQLVASQEAEGEAYVPPGEHLFRVGAPSDSRWEIVIDEDQGQ